MNKSQLINLSLQDQTSFFNKKINDWAHLAWLDFTRSIGLILGQDVKTMLPEDKIDTLESLLKSLQLRNYKLFSGKEFFDSTTAINVTLRDLFIAKNLSKLFFLSDEIGKPLVSILGNAHIAGVTKILTGWGYTIQGTKELDELLLQNSL